MTRARQSSGTKNKTVLVLTKTVQDAVNEGICKAARRFKIKLKGRKQFYFKLNGHYHGNKRLKPGTAATYKEHYKQLWTFLAKIGDYESMLLLVSPRLKDVPSMKLSSLSAFLRYKKMAKGAWSFAR